MIVLFYAVVTFLSFTRVPTWLQVALMLAPPLVLSAVSRDAGPATVAVLALAAALALYAPLAWLGSRFLRDSFKAVFRRFRFVYFVVFLLMFVVLTFNLTQLVGVV